MGLDASQINQQIPHKTPSLNQNQFDGATRRILKNFFACGALSIFVLRFSSLRLPRVRQTGGTVPAPLFQSGLPLWSYYRPPSLISFVPTKDVSSNSIIMFIPTELSTMDYLSFVFHVKPSLSGGVTDEGLLTVSSLDPSVTVILSIHCGFLFSAATEKTSSGSHGGGGGVLANFDVAVKTYSIFGITERVDQFLKTILFVNDSCGRVVASSVSSSEPPPSSSSSEAVMMNAASSSTMMMEFTVADTRNKPVSSNVSLLHAVLKNQLPVYVYNNQSTTISSGGSAFLSSSKNANSDDARTKMAAASSSDDDAAPSSSSSTSFPLITMSGVIEQKTSLNIGDRFTDPNGNPLELFISVCQREADDDEEEEEGGGVTGGTETPATPGGGTSGDGGSGGNNFLPPPEWLGPRKHSWDSGLPGTMTLTLDKPPPSVIRTALGIELPYRTWTCALHIMDTPYSNLTMPLRITIWNDRPPILNDTADERLSVSLLEKTCYTEATCAIPVPRSLMYDPEDFPLSWSAALTTTTKPGFSYSQTEGEGDGAPLPEWISFDRSTLILTVSPDQKEIGLSAQLPPKFRKKIFISVITTDVRGQSTHRTFPVEIVLDDFGSFRKIFNLLLAIGAPVGVLISIWIKFTWIYNCFGYSFYHYSMPPAELAEGLPYRPRYKRGQGLIPPYRIRVIQVTRSKRASGSCRERCIRLVTPKGYRLLNEQVPWLGITHTWLQWDANNATLQLDMAKLPKQGIAHIIMTGVSNRVVWSCKLVFKDHNLQNIWGDIHEDDYHHYEAEETVLPMGSVPVDSHHHHVALDLDHYEDGRVPESEQQQQQRARSKSAIIFDQSDPMYSQYQPPSIKSQQQQQQQEDHPQIRNQSSALSATAVVVQSPPPSRRAQTFVGDRTFNHSSSSNSGNHNETGEEVGDVELKSLNSFQPVVEAVDPLAPWPTPQGQKEADDREKSKLVDKVIQPKEQQLMQDMGLISNTSSQKPQDEEIQQQRRSRRLTFSDEVGGKSATTVATTPSQQRQSTVSQKELADDEDEMESVMRRTRRRLPSRVSTPSVANASIVVTAPQLSPSPPAKQQGGSGVVAASRRNRLRSQSEVDAELEARMNQDI